MARAREKKYLTCKNFLIFHCIKMYHVGRTATVWLVQLRWLLAEAKVRIIGIIIGKILQKW